MSIPIVQLCKQNNRYENVYCFSVKITVGVNNVYDRLLFRCYNRIIGMKRTMDTKIPIVLGI